MTMCLHVPISELVAAARNPLTAAPAPLQESIQRGSAIVSFPPAGELAGAVASYIPSYTPEAEVKGPQDWLLQCRGR